MGAESGRSAIFRTSFSQFAVDRKFQRNTENLRNSYSAPTSPQYIYKTLLISTLLNLFSLDTGLLFLLDFFTFLLRSHSYTHRKDSATPPYLLQLHTRSRLK